MGIKTLGRNLGKDIRLEAKATGNDLKEFKSWAGNKVRSGISSARKFYRDRKSGKPMKKATVKGTVRAAGKWSKHHFIDPVVKSSKSEKEIKKYLRNSKGRISDRDALALNKKTFDKLNAPIQVGSMAATKVTAVTPGLQALTIPIGAASNVPLVLGSKIVGTEKSNSRLLKKLKSGERLAPSERMRLAMARKRAKFIRKKAVKKREKIKRKIRKLKSKMYA